MLADGFFTNVAVFPAVGVHGAGLRILLNLHQTFDDITRLVRSLRDATSPREAVRPQRRGG